MRAGRGLVPTPKALALRSQVRSVVEPEYAQEMRGIAEGAGCDFEAIVLINARTVATTAGGQRATGAAPVAGPAIGVFQPEQRQVADLHPALTATLWQVDGHLLWPALILSSSFVADATLTLLGRMVSGRRWYTAHREHLYQWMVRSGFTHATGGACYLTWNMLVAAPLALLAWARPGWSVPVFIGTYLIATAVWIFMKRRCLRRVWDKGRHVAT